MKTKKTFALLVLLAGMAGLAMVPPAASAATVVIETGVPPPAPRVEAVPPPRSGYVWVAGHWGWRNGAHVWIPGHWTAARKGYNWVPAHWVEMPNGHWRYVDGHWAH
jgi:hypothetical protein